jgi:hypothetical protein
MSRYQKVFLILLLVPAVAMASTFGSRSLLHVQTASTLNSGTLDFRYNLNFFSKIGDYLGQNKPANFSAVNWWDVQSNALLTYGFAEHFDGTLMNRVYQDRNAVGGEYNSPEDIFIDLKAASFGLSNNRFNYGIMTSLRIPTGKTYNYAFEPYTAGAFEYGFMGLFSFYNDPYLHDRSFSLHFNLGWYNHNDAGKVLYTNKAGFEYKADGNATEMQYGIGFQYPTELFDLNLELWGNSFIHAPDSMAYSRENYAYITPSIRFKPRQWMSFDLGLDLRVSSNDNTTSKLLPDPTQSLQLPNYPSWKVNLGVNFTLMPITQRNAPGGKADVRNKVDFYENLLRERQRTRSIEDELRRLKKEREQAEKELEELRQMLEEQGK